MKAVVLNGVGVDYRRLDRTGEIIAGELSALNFETESLILRDLAIAPCMGCFGCWTQTPGICLIDDDARKVTRKMVESDLIVYLTPITFGGYSSDLKKALDRSIGIVLPFFTKINGEVHHKKRYQHAPMFVAVGTLPQPDDMLERIFKALVGRNAINMHNEVHAACVVYDDQSDHEIAEVVKMALSDLGMGR